MPCKDCHKLKVKKEPYFKVGKRYKYRSADSSFHNEMFICAAPIPNKYVLISLTDGERWSDIVKNIDDVKGSKDFDNFTEV